MNANQVYVWSRRKKTFSASLRMYILFCLLLMFAGSCSTNKSKLPTKSEELSFNNPVFSPILADPTVIRDPNTGDFYAYGTEDNWGDGQGSRLMPILKSANLTDWQYVGEVFQEKPSWKKGGGLWAPDINLIDGKYYLYYSYSLWGDPDPGIGLAIADKPEGPFVDQGKLFTSKEIQVPNSIDPSLFQENGQKMLIWGSFADGPDQGIHCILLNDKGTAIAEGEGKQKLAAGDWEAAMLHKRGDYYYFFGSKGSCCEGADSQYKVFVARSRDITGPYLDREGHAIVERNRGTLLLKGDQIIAGPGHHAKIVTDDAGQDWLLYHAIWKEEPKVASGASRRTLMLDKLNWKDGWPEMKDSVPNRMTQVAPIFKK